MKRLNSSVNYTITSSPSGEEHIELSAYEFGFDVEYVKPLIAVSLIKDNSGKDLTFHKQVFRL